MNELPFFEGKSELSPNFSSIDIKEQDLHSPGNIAALLATAKMNNRKAKLLIEYFKTIESLKNASPLELEQVAKCGKVDFSNLKYSSIQENSGVKVITYFDDDYPIGFKDLSDAPLLLWVR